MPSHLFHKFLKIFFQLLYHPLACCYDLVAALVSLGRWTSWVKCVEEYVEGRAVLEIGHGPGHLLVALSQNGFCAIGLDESKQMGRIAHQRLGKLQRNSTVSAPRLVRGLSQVMPFSAEAFETVVATFPSEYIFDPRTLDEINRILALDGKLVILLAAWFTGQNICERAAAWLFQITGQSSPKDIQVEKCLSVFTTVGFSPQIVYKNVNGSQLLFILASKSLGH